LDCLQMKARFLIGLAGLAVVVAGCIGTVNGRKTAGVPFIKDRLEARYERPASQVFDAAKDVVKQNGALISESTLHAGTNGATVLSLEGRVNQRTVWISVQQVDPKISSVIVQARNKAGGSDIDLCAYLDRQIAIRLTR
jgi:hypothetical protein